MARKLKPKRRLTNGGVPCPKCGSSSRVLRTSLGKRVKRSPRNYVLRERVCLSTARHRFHTEERPKS